MRTLISGGGTRGPRWANGDWAGVELTMYAWNWREEECKHGSGLGGGGCAAPLLQRKGTDLSYTEAAALLNGQRCEGPGSMQPCLHPIYLLE